MYCFVIRRHISYLKQIIAKIKLLPHSTAHENFIFLKPLVVFFSESIMKAVGKTNKKMQIEVKHFVILWLSLR